MPIAFTLRQLEYFSAVDVVVIHLGEDTLSAAARDFLRHAAAVS
jgi:hypothetical protein